MMDQDLLAALRVVVDVGRIRLLGRLADRPADAASLAAAVRRPLPAVRRDLELLAGVGVVEDRGGSFAIRTSRLGALAGSLAALDRELAGREHERGGAWPHDGDPLEVTVERLGLDAAERKVLRSFLVDGRLVSIPVRGSRRDVILRVLRERVFTEDRDYPEKEVNQRLARFHPDVATLRRYLVDEGMVTRAAGLYRRAGASPPPRPAEDPPDEGATR
jgi:hypothetical protein